MARVIFSLSETLFLTLYLCLVLSIHAAPVDTDVIAEGDHGVGQTGEQSQETIDEVIEHANTGVEVEQGNENGAVQVDDVILTPEQENILQENHGSDVSKRRQHALVTLWPGGVVPYGGLSSLTSSQRTMMKEAFRVWERHTCIRFVPAEPHHEHVLVFRTRVESCSSELGMDASSPTQPVNLGPGCHAIQIYLHELGHALGLVHEHQLPQRDEYIRVELRNVRQGYTHNFNKYSEQDIPNARQVPYSFRSIMHYGKYAFSKNHGTLQTIFALNKSQEKLMGKAVTLARSDTDIINRMYCVNNGR